MTISFEREKCLRVTVTNGAGIVNSTSEKIMLRLNQEDSKIAPGDTIYFLNLKMLISIQISHSWSNPISLDPDSQVCHDPGIIHLPANNVFLTLDPDAGYRWSI